MTTDLRRPLDSASHGGVLWEAMASYPSGVTIVTTADAHGRWWGFTATSFCSLSADPPLVLVCLAKTAQCHPVFLTAPSWVVQVVAPEHAELAQRFATRGADKFADAQFVTGSAGHPVLQDACAVLECEAYDRYNAGDHTILVGYVCNSLVRDTTPAVYFRRAFHDIRPHRQPGAAE